MCISAPRESTTTASSEAVSFGGQPSRLKSGDFQFEAFLIEGGGVQNLYSFFVSSRWGWIGQARCHKANGAKPKKEIAGEVR